MGYAYLAAFVFAFMVQFLNFYPMFYKAKVMRGKSGNLRAHMIIYHAIGEGANENAIV